MKLKNHGISENLTTFDLPNIDLGPKNNTTNREYSASAICWSFPRSSTTLRLEMPKGSHPPYTGEGGKTPFTGEG